MFEIFKSCFKSCSHFFINCCKKEDVAKSDVFDTQFESPPSTRNRIIPGNTGARKIIRDNDSQATGGNISEMPSFESSFEPNDGLKEPTGRDQVDRTSCRGNLDSIIESG